MENEIICENLRNLRIKKVAADDAPCLSGASRCRSWRV